MTARPRPDNVGVAGTAAAVAACGWKGRRAVTRASLSSGLGHARRSPRPSSTSSSARASWTDCGRSPRSARPRFAPSAPRRPGPRPCMTRTEARSEGREELSNRIQVRCHGFAVDCHMTRISVPGAGRHAVRVPIGRPDRGWKGARCPITLSCPPPPLSASHPASFAAFAHSVPFSFPSLTL